MNPTVYEFNEMVKLELHLYKDDQKVKAVCNVLDENYDLVRSVPLVYRGQGFHAQAVLLDPGHYVLAYSVTFDNNDPDGYENVSEAVIVNEQPSPPEKHMTGFVESTKTTALTGNIE